MESRIFYLAIICSAFLLSYAEGHGHLSIPQLRNLTKRQDENNPPVAYPLQSDFVCRNDLQLDPFMWTTYTAGQNADIQWAFEAAHPGDCFAYISYDVNVADDTKKKWFKIAQWNDCNMINLQTQKMLIPANLPPCAHCILRWEWYALHLRDINIIEWYSQCSDIKIVSNAAPNAVLPTPQVTIPGHLPMAPQYYRSEFKNPDLVLFTGPPIATQGGAAWSCSSTYGQSCTVAPPDPNPCTISHQKCVSDTQYSACGIGATSTEWKPAQSCQTGLVCQPHPDGAHILCTYPPASSTTTTTTTTGKPSTTGKQSTPATTGKKNAVTTGLKAGTTTTTKATTTTTKASTTTTTSARGSTSTSGSSADDCCTNGNMRCSGASSYQTCSNQAWGPQQNCQKGLSCNPYGNVIYCY